MLGDLQRDVFLRLGGGGAEVRRAHHVVEREQLVFGRRLRLENVERRARDMPFLQRSLQELNTLSTPFHATLFTLTSHHPYAIPEAYNKVLPKGTLPIHQSVHYTDESLRLFFQNASTQPWYSNTLFVITADHTALAEHPFYKTRAGIYAIPVVYFSPCDSITGISDRTTQQIDILPSVMDYLNYPDTFFALGSSVFDSQPAGHAINFLNGTFQLINDNYSFVFDTLTHSGLFDFQKDPQQRMNLADNLSATGKSMEMVLKATLQQHNNAMIENKMFLPASSR